MSFHTNQPEIKSFHLKKPDFSESAVDQDWSALLCAAVSYPAVSQQPRAEREPKGALVNLQPQAEREAKEVLLNIPPLAKREAEGD